MNTPPIKQECLCDCHTPDFSGWIVPIQKPCCSCHKRQECCCEQCAYPFAKEQDVDTSSAACQVCPCHKGQDNTADRHRMAHILRPPVDAHKRMGELHDEIEGQESQPEVFMVGGVAEVVRDLDWEPLKSAVTDEDLDAAIKLLPKSESWDTRQRIQNEYFEAGKREGLKTALEIFKNKIFHRGTPTEAVEAIEMALLNLTPHHDKS